MPDDRYTGKLRLKVSAKGAIQLDGMRRMPITLYKEEMEAILTRADAIRGFIAANDAALKAKPDGNGDGGGGHAI